MIHKYHSAILTETLSRSFSTPALCEIIQANLEQDSLQTFFQPEIHFDESKFAEAMAYIEEQQAIITRNHDPHDMRKALGRLTHGAQDFYAHSNYVDLWLDQNGGLERTRAADIDGLDPSILNNPALRSDYFYWWRDFIYYVPLFKTFAKKYLVFVNSHESMHLDDPSRGPKFFYALKAAKQRTLVEYQRALKTVDPAMLHLFHGKPEPQFRLTLPRLKTA